jgi:hypothetical protein
MEQPRLRNTVLFLSLQCLLVSSFHILLIKSNIDAVSRLEVKNNETMQHFYIYLAIRDFYLKGRSGA